MVAALTTGRFLNKIVAKKYRRETDQLLLVAVLMSKATLTPLDALGITGIPTDQILARNHDMKIDQFLVMPVLMTQDPAVINPFTTVLQDVVPTGHRTLYKFPAHMATQIPFPKDMLGAIVKVEEIIMVATPRIVTQLIGPSTTLTYLTNIIVIRSALAVAVSMEILIGLMGDPELDMVITRWLDRFRIYFHTVSSHATDKVADKEADNDVNKETDKKPVRSPDSHQLHLWSVASMFNQLPLDVPTRQQERRKTSPSLIALDSTESKTPSQRPHLLAHYIKIARRSAVFLVL